MVDCLSNPPPILLGSEAIRWETGCVLPLRLVAGVDVCFMPVLLCLSVPALGLMLFSRAHRGHTIALVQSLRFQPVVATLLVAKGSHLVLTYLE